MSTPAEVVAESFAQANSYASNAQTQLTSFTSALTGAISLVPALDVTWAPVTAPPAVAAPIRPGALEDIETELTFDQSGAITASLPDSLAISAPTLSIDEFSESAPTVTLPAAPTLDFGTAPVLDFGTAPTVPAPNEVALPDVPTVAMPSTPTYLALSTPTFAGVDLHASFLANLDNVPSLALVAPTPYTYTQNPQYSSDLLTAVKATLVSRLSGGTGLDPTVEAAIWDRARDREASTAQANIDQVARDGEALGFKLPAGVTNEGVRRASEDYFTKVSTLSRDIAVKQAELEQENLKTTITQVLELEGKLVSYAYQLENISFESAKAVAQNSVECYNAQVGQFHEVVTAYTAYASAYRAIIDGELAKVEVYKAQIQAELAKAQTNHTLVEQYKAEIEARMATVRLYEVQVSAAKTLVELEGVKINAAAEQVRAYVAGINGETAKVEAYKVGVQAQGEIAKAYTAQVEGQVATVQIYKIKADAFTAKVSGQAEAARANTSYFESLVRAKTAEWDGWRARVGAEAERVKAIGMKSQSALDGYRADIIKYEAELRQSSVMWETQIKQYEAQKNYVITTGKLNADISRANADSVLKAAQVGAQVYSQLVSSAYGMIHASAGVSASAGNQVSYSYSNDTATAPPAVTAV